MREEIKMDLMGLFIGHTLLVVKRGRMRIY